MSWEHPAEERAAAIEVAVHHGITVASAWADTTPGPLNAWLAAAGVEVERHGAGRLTPETIERSLPRAGCPCPMCVERSDPVMDARRAEATRGMRAEPRHRRVELFPAKAGWMAAGACRGHGPVLWFSDVPREQAAARRVCAGCVVREVCLEYALANRVDHGIWGGESERARRRMLRARRSS